MFYRFAGCDLWSGREIDRASSACTFCDTEFVGLDGAGDGRFPNAGCLAAAVASAWTGAPDNRLTVRTGGAAVRYGMANPRWRPGLQTPEVLGIA